MWNDIVKANCARANTTASQPSNIAPPIADQPGAKRTTPGATIVRRQARNRVLPSATGVQQPRHGAVDLLILALAIVLEHDFAVLVNDVLRRPILVAVGVP